MEWPGALSHLLPRRNPPVGHRQAQRLCNAGTVLPRPLPVADLWLCTLRSAHPAHHPVPANRHPIRWLIRRGQHQGHVWLG